MRTYIIPAVLLLTILLAGCSPSVVSLKASGTIVTQNHDISGFDRLDVSHAFQVDVSQGENYSVLVQVDERLLDYTVVEQHGTTLTIGLEPNRVYNMGPLTRRVAVRMPELTELELSGASKAALLGFKSLRDLEAHLSGASSLQGDVQAEVVRLEASGASDIELQGKAGDLRLGVSGASTVDLATLSADSADLEVSGASKVTLNVDGTLDVEASGASRVYYHGRPRMGSVETSGASTVKRR